MAATVLSKLPAKITTTATTEEEYKFNHPTLNASEITLLIELPSANSGTVKFGVGASANNSDTPAYVAGSKVILEIVNNEQNLHVYASASSDEIWISAVD